MKSKQIPNLTSTTFHHLPIYITKIKKYNKNNMALILLVNLLQELRNTCHNYEYKLEKIYVPDGVSK